MVESIVANLELILQQNLSVLICPCCKQNYTATQQQLYKLKSGKRFAIYCSKRCGSLYKNARNNYAINFIRNCSFCEIEYKSNKTINNKTNFCSTNCFEKYTATIGIEFIHYFCKCGNHKDSRAKECNDCSCKNYWTKIHRTLVCDLLENRKKKINTREIDVMIRSRARQYLEHLNIDKVCNVCDFRYVVETCHIIPVATFDFNLTYLGEINHINNLVYLCPNHHAMLDRGIELKLFKHLFK